MFACLLVVGAAVAGLLQVVVHHFVKLLAAVVDAG